MIMPHGGITTVLSTISLPLTITGKHSVEDGDAAHDARKLHSTSVIDDLFIYASV